MTLAWLGSFGECFGEEGEHFFDSLALEEAVGGEVAGHGDWGGLIGGGGGAEDCYADHFHLIVVVANAVIASLYCCVL